MSREMECCKTIKCKMCNCLVNNTNLTEPSPLPPQESCELCKQILLQIEHELHDKPTNAEIVNAVRNVCKAVPKDLSKRCKKFIHKHGEDVIKQLELKVPPKNACKALKLCDDIQLNAPPEEVHSLECELCKRILREIEHAIVGEPTDKTINHAVEHVCEIVPKGLLKKCNTFINKHGQEIIKFLKSNVLPREVCKVMQLCGGEMFENYMDQPNALDNNISPKCALCKIILKEIEFMVVGAATEEKIGDAVRHVCKAVPMGLSKQCGTFIDKLGETIIKMLAANILPKEICKMLKHCKVSESIQSISCPICNSLMEQFKQTEALNTTKEKLMHALRQECNATFANSEDCNTFVTDYGEDVVGLLKTISNPKEICETLLPCSGIIDSVKSEIRSCAVCNIAVHQMNTILQNLLTNHSLEYLLENSCENLSPEQHDMCEGLMLFDGKRLYEMLVDSSNINKVCHDVGLCGTELFVGVNRCTWGPGYWCVNQATARECNVINHCEQEVWTNKKSVH